MGKKPLEKSGNFVSLGKVGTVNNWLIGQTRLHCKLTYSHTIQSSSEISFLLFIRRKAILQNMPQMATLGSTPFTPVPKRHGKLP